VNRVMVTQAKRRIAVVDRSKFGTVAEWQICPVETCDLIITDSALPDVMLAPFEERKLEVRRV
jgi:DeoR/GlpR family transcriptional regulator of sugar metabolism